MNQVRLTETFYKRSRPTAADESVKMRIEEGNHTFFVYKTSKLRDSRTGVLAIYHESVSTQDCLPSYSEAQELYEAVRKQLAVEGFKHAYKPDVIFPNHTYEAIV
jgi:hypothetical protein